eukprot:gene7461-4256_t
MTEAERAQEKAATAKRKASPAAKAANAKRMASPAAKAATAKRLATPAALAAWRRRKRATTAKMVGEPLGDRRLCPHCGAFVWKIEDGMCCQHGKHITAPLPRPPPDLLRWEGPSAFDPWTVRRRGKEVPWQERPVAPQKADGLAGVFTDEGFSSASRRINCHFAFCSVGEDESRAKDARQARAAAGKPAKPVYGFVKLAGRVYHCIPGDGDTRNSVPFYVHDTTPTTAEPSDARWLQTIHATLMRVHPLARTLCAAREVDGPVVRVVPAPHAPRPQYAAEIAARYRITDDADDIPDRQFVVFSREGGVHRYPRINHELYETLAYPLAYPHGTLGWWAKSNDVCYQDIEGNPMTLLWYARQRMFREATLHACGRMFNEWLVDTFCRIDDNRLRYIASPEGQKKIRIAEKSDVEHYCEDIAAGRGNAAEDKPGRIYLPSGHIGSRRHMWMLLQNALTLSSRRKKATFFDTMTCNPHWDEITSCLHPGQTAYDRPDITSRVFRRKLDEVLRAISSGKWHTRWKKKGAADPVTSGQPADISCHESEELEDTELVWRVYVIEYQERGLPHAHLVYRVEAQDGSQPLLAEHIDRVVQARFPDKDPATGKYKPEDERYVELIKKHMIHHCSTREGGCRPPGWQYLRCKDGFPFPICAMTHVDPRGFVEYARLTEEDGRVVPHVREILEELDCHYCRLVASLSKVLKYLMKYLHKGPDTASSKIVALRKSTKFGPPRELAQEEIVDEVHQYQYERHVGACEAAWRLCAFTNHHIWPTTRSINVDDEGRQKIVIPDAKPDVDALQQKIQESVSNVEIYFRRPLGADFDRMHFVDYFERYAGTMRDDPSEVPKTHVHHAVEDQRDPPVRVYPRRVTRVCRVPPVGPGKGETFFLYVLLKNRAARSFQDIRTVEGVVYSKYRDAVRALGLMADDNEYNLCLRQAMKELGWSPANATDPSSEACGPSLRTLFVTLMMQGADWNALRAAAGDALLDDFLHQAPGDREAAEEMLRADVTRRLRSNGKDPSRDYRWPLPRAELSELQRLADAMKKQHGHYVRLVEEAEKLMDNNPPQRAFYDKAVAAIRAGEPCCMYLDGKAGRGKSLTVRAIHWRCRRDGLVGLPTASTGVAAGDYEDGATAHSLFGIPIDENGARMSKQSCNIGGGAARKQRAELLRAAAVITWDELPMAHRFDFEAVDDLLRDVRGSDAPFGGVVFIGAGDFRQTAPVIRGADGSKVVDASVRRSKLWKQFVPAELTTPVRDREDLEYSAFVDKLGAGAGHYAVCVLLAVIRQEGDGVVGEARVEELVELVDVGIEWRQDRCVSPMKCFRR